jgi:hypothetical protein
MIEMFDTENQKTLEEEEQKARERVWKELNPFYDKDKAEFEALTNVD